MADQAPGRPSAARAGQSPPASSPGRRSAGTDALFVGILVLLLAMPSGVWVATKLAGWFQHGHWPSVGFGDAITAIKGLFFHPGDIALAWPAGKRAGLPSTGIFWAVLLGLIVVAGAIVLDVALMVRRRVVRRRAAQEAIDSFLGRGN